MDEKLNAKAMRRAFSKLDTLLKKPLTLILGGGGAMLLAYDFPLATSDVDAFPKGMELADLDGLVKRVAAELDLPVDWMNPYFSSFAHTLPRDYDTRLVPVFGGHHLSVMALGKEDLLIMKCFAHRPKDVAHGKALLKKGADIHMVQGHIEDLEKQGVPQAKAAWTFLDDLMDQMP